MIWDQVSATLDVIGKVLVSYTVLKVHHRMLKEHKFDDAVYKDIRQEQIMGIIGIILMLVAYGIKMLELTGLIG